MTSFSRKDLIFLKLKELQNSKNHSKYWNISWNLGLYLKNLILILKPNNILEIGTSNGFSTLFLSIEMNEDAKISTIEIDQNRFDEAFENFRKCSLTQNINQLLGNCLEILDKHDFKDKFDFVFLSSSYLSL